jgi:hypothetical protein
MLLYFNSVYEFFVIDSWYDTLIGRELGLLSLSLNCSVFHVSTVDKGGGFGYRIASFGIKVEFYTKGAKLNLGPK